MFEKYARIFYAFSVVIGHISYTPFQSGKGTIINFQASNIPSMVTDTPNTHKCNLPHPHTPMGTWGCQNRRTPWDFSFSQVPWSYRLLRCQTDQPELGI